MIVAHRGASGHAPENTLPAFERAWQDGADAIEGDFRLTRDGHIVCIHDESTHRVAGIDLQVKDATLDKLRRLDVGRHQGEAYAGTVIPTIAEVFSTIPAQKKIYIEIKCGTQIIPGLLDQIAAAGLKSEQVVVIAFSPQVIAAIKERAPQFKAFWLSGFQPGDTGQIQPSLETVRKTLERIKADGFSSHKDLIDAPFIQGVQAAGYEHHVWTVDDVPTARRFKAWGARSISTNLPDLIGQSLRATHGQ